jgi:hypothetical protein
MKTTLSFLACFACLIFPQNSFAQETEQSDPESVIFTQGEYQLRYKHLLAYIAGEMEGEDPARLSDPEVIRALSRECMEEFTESPKEVLEDLEQQYEFMLFEQKNGMVGGQGDRPRSAMPEQGGLSLSSGSEADQWKQTLNGAALQYSYQESYSGGIAQGKQVLHLCRNGTFFIIGYSAVSGSFPSGSVLDKNQGQLMEQGNWDIILVQGVPCIQLTEKGIPYTVPLSVVHNKILLQGIALMDYYPDSAQCH